jgi:hypothetical protein
VEEDDFDPDLVGRIGPLVTATTDVLAFVRRHAQEISDEDLERRDDGSFVHHETRRYGVVTSFIDWPSEQDRDEGVKAFTVRDNLIVPLRESGSTAKVTTIAFGTVGGRRAQPDDPMPLAEGTPVIF